MAAIRTGGTDDATKAPGLHGCRAGADAAWRVEFRFNRRSILAGQAPAEPAAGDDSSVQEQAEGLAREAMEQLMRSLKMFMQSIPQYELPEINENGDIIIRRKRWPEGDDPGEPDDSEAREPEVEQT